MNYQKIIVAGNATVDAERRTSKNGEVTYTTFSVGVADGKEQTTYFPITVFGRHGEAVAKYVTKGREVLVDGRIEVGEKGYFNVIADRVRFGAMPQAAGPAEEKKPAKKKKNKK
jgi:single-strand DNA-binding protein